MCLSFSRTLSQYKALAHVDQGWWLHKNHLQNPVFNEGDRKSLIIAYISVTRLFCTTDEARLLIIPDFQLLHSEQAYKIRKGGEPDLSNHGGMDLNFLQNAPKEIPVPHACLVHHLSSEPHQLGGIKSSILMACYFLKPTCGQNINKASLCHA